MTVINNAHGIEIGGLLEAARLAGARILEVYGREFEIEYKGDDSPLTEADKESSESAKDEAEAHFRKNVHTDKSTKSLDEVYLLTP